MACNDKLVKEEFRSFAYRMIAGCPKYHYWVVCPEVAVRNMEFGIIQFKCQYYPYRHRLNDDDIKKMMYDAEMEINIVGKVMKLDDLVPDWEDIIEDVYDEIKKHN